MHNQRSIGDAIQEFLKHFRLEEKIEETRIVASWEKVMGRNIALFTDRIQMNRKVLTVYLRSAAMRHELNLAKEKIIAMINKEAGKEVITGIRFR